VSQPVLVAGKSGGLPLFLLSGGTWQLQVKTTNMVTGNYLATVVDLSSPAVNGVPVGTNIPSFSVSFTLK